MYCIWHINNVNALKAKICFGKRRRKKPRALEMLNKILFHSFQSHAQLQKIKKEIKYHLRYIHITICYIVIIHWNLQSILQSLKIRWSFCVLLYIVSCLCLYFFFAFAFYTHISNNFMCKCIVKRFFIAFIFFFSKCVYCTMVLFILQFIYAFDGLQV